MTDITGLGFAVGAVSGAVAYAIINKLAQGSSSVKDAAPLTPPVVVPSISAVDEKYNDTVSRLESQFTVPKSRLEDFMQIFLKEMKKGLDRDGEMLMQIPSFVSNRPSGKELGSFLALDLGGTNFRVCEVLLEGQGRVRTRSKKYALTEDLKTAHGDKLFDFFAECVATFLVDHNLPHEIETTLGFTFSFPVQQTGVAEGALSFWNKGFSCEGVVGKDVVQLLQAAIHRNGMKIRVTALVNDTVGTLVAHSYTDTDTHIGIILGTGTNAAYVEKVSNIGKWKGPMTDNGEMIMNSEWGCFNEPSVLTLTKYDDQMDRATANPGIMTFEKLISGMYLGEITRLAMVDLISVGELFSGNSSKEIGIKNAFETAYMSRIERDHSAELSDTKVVLEDLMKISSTTLNDRKIVRRICQLIGTRSARYAAAATAAIVKKMNRLNGVTVAIDGSLFEHYPHYDNRMRDTFEELLGSINAREIKLELAHDGSGQGAALIAAVA